MRPIKNDFSQLYHNWRARNVTDCLYILEAQGFDGKERLARVGDAWTDRKNESGGGVA